jgi:hypothetical protein
MEVPLMQKRYFLSIAPTLLVLLTLSGCNVSQESGKAPNNGQGIESTSCKSLNQAWEKEHDDLIEKNSADYLVSIHFSPTYKSCIRSQQKRDGNEFTLRDLSGSILQDGENNHLLLDCDEEGANSAKLDVVLKHNGRVTQLDPSEWLDDGRDGAAKVYKIGSRAFTKEQCKAVMEIWKRRLSLSDLVIIK